MRSPVTVLVVDDSLVVRGAIVRLLKNEAGIEVVATAADGRSALEKVEHVRPDVVLLDIEMPRMDGLQFLTELRSAIHRPAVLVLSSLTTRGAMVTLEALSRGAADYVTKPSTLGRGSTPQDLVRDLAARIRLIANRTRVGSLRPPRASVAEAAPRAPSPRPARDAPYTLRRSAARHPVAVLAIGASTGGPNALMELLQELPANFPVPVLIVQHMPPLFTSQLARSLDKRCALRAREVAHGDSVEAGHIYVAPGDYHMRVRRFASRVQVLLDQTDPVRSCRPSVDVLFDSVAECYGAGVLGVVLTGMGSDGLDGSRTVVEAGGTVITQDEATSVVWGMPGDVTRAGLSSAVLPLSQIGQAILARTMSDGAAVQLGPGEPTP